MQGLKIFIVDDDIDFAESLSDIFEKVYPSDRLIADGDPDFVSSLKDT